MLRWPEKAGESRKEPPGELADAKSPLDELQIERGSGAHLQFDLGEVGDLAEAIICDAQTRAVWHAPCRLDIGKLERPASSFRPGN